MKRMIIWAVALVTLTACEKVDLPEQDGPQIGNGTTDEGEVRKRFTFTIKGDFTNPEFTRANAYMTADGSEMTDLWVIDYKDGEIKQSLHQVNTDADWGAPSMSLTLGTHHVLFLASRGTEPQYQNGVVMWTKPYDTFYCDYEVTVVKTSNGNRAVTLDRVATKLQLTIEDAVPVGTTSIVFEPELWYTGFDMINGTPVAADDYQQTLSIPASWGGKTGKSAVSWSLSTADEWLTDLHYTSYAGTAVNGEILIKDAPLKANRTTKYAGNFYSNAEASSVTLNAEWLADYEGVY